MKTVTMPWYVCHKDKNGEYRAIRYLDINDKYKQEDSKDELSFEFKLTSLSDEIIFKTEPIKIKWKPMGEG